MKWREQDEKEFYFGGLGLGILEIEGNSEIDEKVGLSIDSSFLNGKMKYGYLKFFGGIKYQFNESISSQLIISFLTWPQSDGKLTINDNGNKHEVDMSIAQLAILSNIGFTYHF